MFKVNFNGMIIDNLTLKQMKQLRQIAYEQKFIFEAFSGFEWDEVPESNNGYSPKSKNMIKRYKRIEKDI